MIVTGSGLPASAWVLHKEGSFTDSASVDIQNITAYRTMKLVLRFKMPTANGSTKMTVNNDGGNHYAYIYMDSAITQAINQAYIYLSGGPVNTSDEICLEVLFNGIGSVHHFSHVYSRDTTIKGEAYFGGMFRGAADVTRLTISSDGKTFTGVYAIYYLQEG